MGERNSFNNELIVFIDDLLHISFKKVKDDLEVKGGSRVPQLSCNDLVKSQVTVKVQVIHSSLQVHGEEQSHQAKVMVAVKVCDKDMIDPVEVGLVLHELHLGAFATVDQEITASYFQEL